MSVGRCGVTQQTGRRRWSGFGPSSTLLPLPVHSYLCLPEENPDFPGRMAKYCKYCTLYLTLCSQQIFTALSAVAGDGRSICVDFDVRGMASMQPALELCNHDLTPCPR